MSTSSDREGGEPMNRYWGVDLHRNCFTVCTLKEDGQSEFRKWSIHSLSGFAHTVQATDAVAVEATGNTRYFYRSLKERRCRLVVVNPQQFQAISHSKKKADAHDARTLAQFLARDMLPEVRMKEALPAEIVSVLQIRDKLVKLRTTLKIKINNLLAGQGILIRRESLSSDKGLEQVLQASVSDLEGWSWRFWQRKSGIYSDCQKFFPIEGIIKITKN
jgi:transposase